MLNTRQFAFFVVYRWSELLVFFMPWLNLNEDQKIICWYSMYFSLPILWTIFILGDQNNRSKCPNKISRIMFWDKCLLDMREKANNKNCVSFLLKTIRSKFQIEADKLSGWFWTKRKLWKTFQDHWHFGVWLSEKLQPGWQLIFHISWFYHFL